MKNKIYYLGIVFLLFLISSFAEGCLNAQNTSKPDEAFAQNIRLGRGVNILSADAVWDDTTKARMNARHFKFIKDAGFNNVRIAIHPFKYALNKTDFKIDTSFFIALDWALKQALANKLMAIVDLHEHHAMQENPTGNKAMFLSMWKQIAEHCKSYPNEVLFEICNEPNMKPELWNEIHKSAYEILRQSNPQRTLIIGTVYGNQIMYLKDLVLPKNDRNIIVAIHYYMPIEFTHQGAPWSQKSKDLSGITWTNKSEEEQAIIADFNTAQVWAQKNNRPLTLGEFGAYEKADMASRVRWTNFVSRQAENRNWSWSYWQFDSDFIVYDINKNNWVEPILRALIPK